MKKAKQHTEMQELCALFQAADAWGRERILRTARSQAGQVALPPQLSLVPTAVLDQPAHVLDNLVNSRSLTLVS